MSDVGRLKKAGGTVFPSIRKSADAFQPEQGEMDFSQDLLEFDIQNTTAVRETEQTEQSIIRDENRRKQYRQRKKKRKKDEEENSEEDKDRLIDLSA